MYMEKYMTFRELINEEATITTTTAGDVSTEGGSGNFADKVGKILRRNPKQKDIGYTSTDNDHKHKAYVDESGNGETSENKKHSHKISKRKVQKVNNHIHTI